MKILDEALLGDLIFSCVDQEELKDQVLKMVAYTVGRQIESAVSNSRKIVEDIVRKEVLRIIENEEIRKAVSKMILKEVRKITKSLEDVASA